MKFFILTLLLVALKIFFAKGFYGFGKINESDKDVTSAITQFCLGKEKENFCSDEHLMLLINFAALQGKARPILDEKELEMERKKEIEKQNKLKLEQEIEKKKRLELQKERTKQREKYLEEKKKLEQLKKREEEMKIFKLITQELNDIGKNKLIFRF